MVTLRVHVIPSAKIDNVVGELATASPSCGGHGGAIKIKLRAPAVEGKANVALIDFLSERLKVPARTIVLLRGQRSRDKLVRIDSLNEEDIQRRLL
jgi:uncharacterized protein (TIGR00251 family)